jgi:HK97 family phage major capsid protein
MDEKQLADLISKTVDERVAGVKAQMDKDAELKAMADRTVVDNKLKDLTTIAQVKDSGVTDTHRMGRLIKIMAKAGNNPERGRDIFKADHKNFPDQKGMEDLIDSVGNKSQNMTVPSEGGFLVNVGYSPIKVDPLLADTILAKLAITKIDMPNGNITIRTMSSQGAAGWNGESRDATKVSSVFGTVKMASKKLDAYAVISNELLMSDALSTDAWIVQILQKQFERNVDNVAFYGTGTLYQPAGLDNLIVSTNKLGSSATATTQDTPFQLVAQLKGLNAPVDGSWFFGMHPQMFYYLQTLKTTTGAYIFREELSKGTLLGFPVLQSTNFGYTSTGTFATSSADIWLGPASEMLWGQQQGMEIITSREASYMDGATLQSAFSRNETVIRAIQFADFNVQHTNTIIKWTGKFAAA